MVGVFRGFIDGVRGRPDLVCAAVTVSGFVFRRLLIREAAMLAMRSRSPWNVRGAKQGVL